MAAKVFFGGFALFLIVQSSFILAFDCNSVSSESYETCLQIQNMDLSDDDKSLLSSNIDYSSKYKPDHSYVYERNTNLEVTDAPDGVVKQNGQFVRDAWVSLMAVMPSVLYKNELYVPSQAQSLSKFDYSVEVPSDYYSSGYPNTNGGDCKRTYSLNRNDAINRVYVNNAYQGDGELVDLNINSDAEIKSVYFIDVEVSVRHYHWQRYCSKRVDGKCKKYSYKCSYNSEETQSDHLSLTDSMNVRRYNSVLLADVQAVNSYSGTTRIQLNNSNSVEVGFEDSSYSFNEFVYSIIYSKKPYYVYTLKADDYKQEKVRNIIKNDKDLLVKNTADCSIKAFDFFNTLEKQCSLAELESTELLISTDKLKYKPDETILVSIEPSNIPVTIKYGGEELEAIGSAQLVAKPLNNKIIAEYGLISSEKVIYVSDRERFAILFNFSVFGVLNYFFYALMRKYWGTYI